MFWVLILLAVVQGVTEFLPISSSGHLVLLYNFFGIENNVKLLSILLHIATLLSVLIYYRKELLVLIKNPFCITNRKIMVTTICTCLVVLIIKPFIDKSFKGEYIFVFFININPEKNIVIAVASYFKPTIFDRVDFIQEYIVPFINEL